MGGNFEAASGDGIGVGGGFGFGEHWSGFQEPGGKGEEVQFVGEIAVFGAAGGDDCSEDEVEFLGVSHIIGVPGIC